jgi:hypothetical protein
VHQTIFYLETVYCYIRSTLKKMGKKTICVVLAITGIKWHAFINHVPLPTCKTYGLNNDGYYLSNTYICETNFKTRNIYICGQGGIFGLYLDTESSSTSDRREHTVCNMYLDS